MKINPNDPKLTAYALGELDETERAELEAQIGKSEELRQAVDEIRHTAELLSNELQAEPLATLTFDQRRAIEAKAASLNGKAAQTATEHARFWRRYWIPTTTAASFLILIGAGVLLTTSVRSLRDQHDRLASATNLKGAGTTGQFYTTQTEESWMTLPTGDRTHARADVAQSTHPSHPPEARSDRDLSAQIALDELRTVGYNGPDAPAAREPMIVADASHKHLQEIETIEQSLVEAWKTKDVNTAIKAYNEAARIREDRTADAHAVQQAARLKERANQMIGDLDRLCCYNRGTAATSTSEPTEAEFRQLLADIRVPKEQWAQAIEELKHLPPPDFGRGAAVIDLQNAGAPAVGVGGVQQSSTQAFWTAVRSGDIIAVQHVNPSSVNDAARSAIEALSYDSDSYDNIAYGYEVPFGPQPVGGVLDVDNRQVIVADKGPFYQTEAYEHIVENSFLSVSQNPLATFSIDVDTASYANVRRFLNSGQLPPPGAVRIEELVNYFDYDYPLPTGDDPFSVIVGVADCPWNPEHLLARIGIKGQEFAPDERPSANLVFLIDVSGSMQPYNKLPLIKDAMRMLVEELSYDDSVAMVVYAGASGLILDSTSCDDKATILSALDDLQAGGSTNGGSGIQLAYGVAIDNFIESGINRVILATDGDFNVGITDRSSLTDLIEAKAKSGVFLSVLGFGMGNYKDSTLETLADKGNGNYAYIDTLREARKVLVEQLTGTLMTIAKDVKIQIEFNPVEVSAYRLIGYENRLLAAQDFNDDTKDAGEIGAGHTVTAFYEIIPGSVDVDLPMVDPLKYQVSPADTFSDGGPRGLKPAARSGELMTVKLRYKQPDGNTSKLIEVPVRDEGLSLADMPDDFVFAVSVASFGMLLRSRGTIPAPASSTSEGPTRDFTFDAVLEMAEPSVGDDPFGHRAEFITLVQQAASLTAPQP